MSGNRPIVIKKVKKVIGGGHHGGLEVAYAGLRDCGHMFFLLDVLINTTSRSKNAASPTISAPASASRSTQGSDGLLGGTAFQEDGARAAGSNRQIEEELSGGQPGCRGQSLKDTGSQAGVPSESALAVPCPNAKRRSSRAPRHLCASASGPG